MSNSNKSKPIVYSKVNPWTEIFKQLDKELEADGGEADGGRTSQSENRSGAEHSSDSKNDAKPESSLVTLNSEFHIYLKFPKSDKGELFRCPQCFNLIPSRSFSFHLNLRHKEFHRLAKALAVEETVENRRLFNRMINQASLKYSQTAGRGDDPVRHASDSGAGSGKSALSKYGDKKGAASTEAARVAKIPKFIVPKSVVEALRHSKPIEQRAQLMAAARASSSASVLDSASSSSAGVLDSAPKDHRLKVKPLVVRKLKKNKKAATTAEKVDAPVSYKRSGVGRPPLNKRPPPSYLDGNELGGAKRTRRSVIAVRSTDDEEEEEEAEKEAGLVTSEARVSLASKRRPVVVIETLDARKASVVDVAATEAADVTGKIKDGSNIAARKDDVVIEIAKPKTAPVLNQSESVVAAPEANRKVKFCDLFSKVCPNSWAKPLSQDARVVHQKSTLKAPQKPPQQAPQHSAEDKPRNEFNLDPRKGQLKQEVAEENALRDAGTTGVDKREDKEFTYRHTRYIPNFHCGVVDVQNPTPCLNDIHCTVHSESLKKSVSGRTLKYDTMVTMQKVALKEFNDLREIAADMHQYDQRMGLPSLENSDHSTLSESSSCPSPPPVMRCSPGGSDSEEMEYSSTADVEYRYPPGYPYVDKVRERFLKQYYITEPRDHSFRSRLQRQSDPDDYNQSLANDERKLVQLRRALNSTTMTSSPPLNRKRHCYDDASTSGATAAYSQPKYRRRDFTEPENRSARTHPPTVTYGRDPSRSRSPNFSSIISRGQSSGQGSVSSDNMAATSSIRSTPLPPSYYDVGSSIGASSRSSPTTSLPRVIKTPNLSPRPTPAISADISPHRSQVDRSRVKSVPKPLRPQSVERRPLEAVITDHPPNTRGPRVKEPASSKPASPLLAKGASLQCLLLAGEDRGSAPPPPPPPSYSEAIAAKVAANNAIKPTILKVIKQKSQATEVKTSDAFYQIINPKGDCEFKTGVQSSKVGVNSSSRLDDLEIQYSSTAPVMPPTTTPLRRRFLTPAAKKQGLPWQKSLTDRHGYHHEDTGKPYSKAKREASTSADHQPRKDSAS